jgi:hypothetical protein
MTITEINQKAQEKLKTLNLDDLIKAWEEVDKRELKVGVARTRGWIMDELEARNKEAFDKWIDSDNGNVRDFYMVGA